VDRRVFSRRLPLARHLAGHFFVRTVRVKVIAGSPKTEFAGALADGTLKVRVAAPAQKGKANEELCRFLAEHYGIPRSAVTIVSGHTAPLKLVRLNS
jgi:uncharacterized protein (TIGR00251 family)